MSERVSDERLAELIELAKGAHVMWNDESSRTALLGWQELLSLRRALHEAKEALTAGADSLLVEETKWERRHYVSGLKADRVAMRELAAQGKQLRSLAALAEKQP